MDPKRPNPPDERTEAEDLLPHDLSNSPGEAPSMASRQTPNSHVNERAGQEEDTDNEQSNASSDSSPEDATESADDEPSSIEASDGDEASQANGLSGESSDSDASDDADIYDDSEPADERSDEDSRSVATASGNEASDIDTSTADNATDCASDDTTETARVASKEAAVDVPRPVRMPTYSSDIQQYNVALPLALPVMLRGADAIFMKALEKALPELCKVFEDQIADYDNQLKFELTAEARALWH
jgi:hypothetical protein